LTKIYNQINCFLYIIKSYYIRMLSPDLYIKHTSNINHIIQY